MHHALEVFERLRPAEGVDSAAYKASETFLYYWHPSNIEAICEKIPTGGWLKGHTYSELRQRGITAIRSYADEVKFDDHELLGTEYGFAVPIDGTWDEELAEPHVLVGSIDRLAVRYYARKLTVCIDDFKTGKEYRFLRHNLQFTAYCYATTKEEFWTGWLGEDGFGEVRGRALYERFRDAGRRGTWINLRQFKMQDAGWRGTQDYARFSLAVTQIAMSIQADIYPLTITGEACTWCSYRDICGSVGVPDEFHGKPE